MRIDPSQVSILLMGVAKSSPDNIVVILGGDGGAAKTSAVSKKINGNDSKKNFLADKTHPLPF